MARLYPASLFMSLDDTGRESLIKNSNQDATNGRCLNHCGFNWIVPLFFLPVKLYIWTFKDEYRNNTPDILTYYEESNNY